MKKILLLPALFAAGMLSAQTMVSWQDVSTPSVGSAPMLDGGVAVTTDNNGHVYTVGNYTNATTIGTDNLTYSGTGRDIFVAKYNTNGTFVKAVSLGSSADDEGYSIAWKTDGSNNYIFVTAYVAGTGTVYVLNDNAGLTTSIIQPIDVGVHPRSIVSYGTNRLMIGGSFLAGCTLPGAAGITLTASNNAAAACTNGCYDSFTAIIDMNADFLYAGNPNSSTNNNEILGICCRNGYIYTTGYFQGDLKWKSTSTTMTAAGNRDAFVASVYMSGSLNQCTFNTDQMQAGSIESQPSGAAGLRPDWKEAGYEIAANGTAIYVTGNLNNASTPLFDGSAYSGAGAFTARINYSGSQLGAVNWVRACTNSGGTAVTRSIGYSIALDANGDVYSSGAAYADTYFKGGSSQTLLSNASNATDRPGYVAKFNSTGTLQWIDVLNQQVVNGQGCEGHGMAADGCSLYNTGWVSASGSFQAGTLTPESVSGTAVAIYIFAFSSNFSVSNNITRCEPCTAFPLTGGMTATGGTSYSWSPTTYLTNANTATPTYSVTTCTTVVTNYTVTITNATCTTAVPFVLDITGHPAANAGSDVSACPNTSYYLGVTGTAGFTYSWAPTTGGYLTAYNVAHPAFSTTNTAVLPITYTLTQTDPCGNVTTDQVVVSANHSCRMADPNGGALQAEVFPNPSTGTFTVNLPLFETESDVELIVTDLAGRTVQQNTVTTAGGPVAIDLSGEPKGVYLLSVVRNGEKEVHQLIFE